MSDRELHNRIAYYNCCILAFAEKFKLSGAEAYRYLRNFMGLDFLIEFYDVEHTQSIDGAVYVFTYLQEEIERGKVNS